MVDIGLVELRIHCQKSPLQNFPNHKIHTATKIAHCVRDRITHAVETNPALTLTDVRCGKGLGFIPSAEDGASSHSGKLSLESRKSKPKNGLLDKDWSPMDFEEVADEVDKKDNEL